MQDNIQRVDELVKKNIIKYKDQQNKKAYEEALKEYQKQAKKQAVKQYTQLVKQGNKRARQKADLEKKNQKKMKKKKITATQFQNSNKEQQKVIEKKKISQEQKQVIDQTINTRAERLMQEIQLQKLNKRLNEQKRKTKLYQLNQKCKKMVSKSHQRIIVPKNIPPERMEILKSLQEKVRGEINDLDDVINKIIDKSNGRNKANPKVGVKNVTQHGNQEENEQFGLSNILFEKSSEQLLMMDYIPI